MSATSNLIALVLMLAASLAWAQSLQVDKGIVTRDDSLKAEMKLPQPLKGEGQLKLTWTDSYGRTVAQTARQVQVDGDTLAVSLPLAPAVAMQNFLAAELTMGEKTVKAAPAEFIVTPQRQWDDYEVFMYYPYRANQQPHLRDISVNAGQIQSGRARDPNGGKIWWAYDYPYYCDQLAFAFYAAYHSPALDPKDKLLREAKEAYKADRSKKDALFRKPCFHDPAAVKAALDGMRQAVQAQMRFKPFMYGTDECGVANLVEAFDFCFDPRTLAAMRPWLLKQYGSLEAINAEWGTEFKSIEEVAPFTTDEMMAREAAAKAKGKDYPNNLSPWADHRTFMNLTFAEAVKAGTDAIKEIDPQAKASLVGCQMPAAFGGYDYWLLGRALDAIEPYNIGNNREIWRSFAPEKPAVTTGFGAGDMEVWRLWYQALHGDRGIIIYDEENRYLGGDGAPTAMGAQIAPTYRELTGGIVKQLSHMTRVNDPIAIHYSQPSITAHWMFERRPLGQGWVDKGSWHERRESDFLRLRQSVIYLLEDNMLQYSFVSYEQLADGSFDKSDAKVLILPQSVAMSKAECGAVRRFVQRGGTVIADCRTALMDEHCKMLAKGQLDDLFGIDRKGMSFAPGKPGLRPTPVRPAESPSVWRTAGAMKLLSAAEPGVTAAANGATAYYLDAADIPAVLVREHGKGRTIYLNAVLTDYHRWRMKPPEGEDLRTYFQALLKTAGVAPQYAVTAADGKPALGVEVHPWQCGELRILGLLRNYGLRVSELGPPEYQKQDAFEQPLEVKVSFPSPQAIYDQRAGKFLGIMQSVSVKLDKYAPTILTILPEPVKAMRIAAPEAARAGEVVDVKLTLEPARPGEVHAFRVRLLGPDGKELRPLTANLAAPKRQAAWRLPIAVSDPAGEYTLEARDVATGTTATRKLTVR